ncbi:zinc ABC transporter substrate-binding protein [Neptuniibacter sp.]|uniref:metal ABC transporter substrate-binding protein n=1 Tax=Neptuniibacter sp. TaxID=1962643 RepID=UPI0026351564|nr:zinc ABC transporter substrate-binding protein [Neptuniibacter sp.]MCP4598490.1 zinc ABC transporter solute-binding protein [Neptuniibacter sp.]
MQRIASKFFAICLLAVASTAQALTIFTCEPEWAALSRELAPEAKIFSATHVYQDPHYIEARPSLIAKLAKADIAICSGAALEAGWLPALQKRAGNRMVRDGAEGMLYLSEFIETIEKHEAEFFSTEHVHPEGNPHFHLDPDRVAELAPVISKRLQAIDPESSLDYQKALEQWQTKWKLLTIKWKMKAAPLKGKPVVIQHTSFSYLTHWLGMNAVADLEPEPGVPPTMAHAQSLVVKTREKQPVAILTNWYQNDRAAQWLAEKTEVKHLNLPATVDLKGEISTLQHLFDHLLSEIQATQ